MGIRIYILRCIVEVYVASCFALDLALYCSVLTLRVKTSTVKCV